jgi:hypothetical protein
MRSQKTKEEYYKDAAMRINASDGALRQCESDGGVLFLLARGIFTFTPSTVSFLDYVGIHQMATRSMEDALRCFDAVMSTHPTNVIALLGKVCYTRDSNVVKKNQELTFTRTGARPLCSTTIRPGSQTFPRCFTVQPRM